MKKRNTRSKLVLGLESVRLLSSKGLDAVIGGAWPTSNNACSDPCGGSNECTSKRKDCL